MAKTKKERAKEMLRNLTPWKDIKKAEGSGGSVFDALAEFMESEVENIYNTKIRETRILETEKNSLVLSIQRLKTQKQETEQQHESLSSDVSSLQTQKYATKKELEELGKQKTEIETYIKALAEKGIDLSLLEKIASFDTKTKEEIYERLDTLEHYKSLKIEIARLETEKADTSSEIAQRNTTRDNVERDLSTLEKQLNEAETRNSILGSISQISELAISQGLNPTSFRLLVSTLNDIGKSSDMAVNDLVQGYQQYGNLNILEDTITRKNAELERLRTEKEKITGDLDAFKDIVKNKLEEAGLDGLDRLGRLEAEQTNTIKGLTKSLETQLNTVSDQLLGL